MPPMLLANPNAAGRLVRFPAFAEARPACHRASSGAIFNKLFNPEGLMARRFASINDAPIAAAERRIVQPDLPVTGT